MTAYLAPELLDKIFSYVEYFSPSLQIDGWPKCTTEWESAIRDQAVEWGFLDSIEARLFKPKTSLVPLLPVSKMWCAIAERRLYKSISINSGHKENFWRYSTLLKTLRHREDLRMLVQELLIVLNEHEDGHDIDLSQHPISEITLHCASVTRLTIYMPYAHQDALQLELMGNLASLQSVVIMSKYRIQHQLRMLFGGGGLIIKWNSGDHLVIGARRWAALKSITFQDLNDYRPLALLSSWHPLIPESALQNFYHNATLDANWLRVLMTSAPSMQSIHIILDLRVPETFDALRRALENWSSTLRQLSIVHSPHSFTDSDSNSAAISKFDSPKSLDDETIRQLAVLEQLRTDTVVVPLRSLPSFQALRRLDYTFVDVEQQDDTSLLDTLRQMPSLTRLRVVADAGWPGERALLSLCDELNIEVELAQRADDCFSHSEDYGWDDHTDDDRWGYNSDRSVDSDGYDWDDHYRRNNN